MEDFIQRASSQSQPLDHSSKSGVDKLKTTKPPLLPKPQIIKSSPGCKGIRSVQDSKQDSMAVNQISQKIVSQGGAKENIAISPKPPTISPKPKLPPKHFVVNSQKSEILSNNAAIAQKQDSNPNQIHQSPTKSVRSPQKNGSKDETGSFTIRKGLLDSSVLPKGLILSQERSAMPTGNGNVDLTIKDLIGDSQQLSEFCKQVENCSKHSHILRGGLCSPPHSHLWKERLQDEKALGSSTAGDSGHSLEACVSFQNEMNYAKALGYINGYKRSEVADYLCKDEVNKSDRKLDESSSDVPKSFLHRFVNSSNQTKEEAIICEDEKSTEKNLNVQSFLHKKKDQNGSKLNKSRSLEPRDSLEIDSGDCAVTLPCKSNDKSPIAGVNKLVKAEALKKSVSTNNSERPSSSEVISFSKRFPWFGSFGKGSKKDILKKERCLSQFYSPTTLVDEQTLREKNRTKSLPDIKHTRIIQDELKTGETEESQGLRISSEYPHSDSDDDKDSLNQMDLGSEKDPKTMAYLKAKELMTSEEVFIDVLKLLNVDFRNYVQFRNFESKGNCIPNGEIDKILNHLSQLQSLNEDILEDLKKRIINWENNPKIADVIVKKGAFLKMYTTYIQSFESRTNYLDECMAKYPKFGKIVKEFEATDRCKKLTLKHYMLKPVQRIPQYRLLLNDYVKHLNESSEDYFDTLAALKIVCEVVDHANRNVSHGDKEGRLMHFQSLLSDFELIKPGRELVKDGPLEKICRKDVRERYFILLNDCLLHTTYSKQYLKIHQELPLSGMKICYNDDQIYPPSFTVHSITKSFILCAKSESECKEWVETLQTTIEGHIKRQKTFLNVKIEEDSSFKLGKEAPVWVQDGKVTMCQICTAEFTALFRRHHCRACGKVVCRNCGSSQAPLQYRNYKADRVCDQCFELILKEYEDSEESICENLKEIMNLSDESAQNEYLNIKAKFIRYTSANSLKKQKYIPPRLKEVSANDSQSVISGWLYRKSRKSWKPFWYVLKEHVLYVYRASEDVLALETIPVLGYEVNRGNVHYEDVDGNLVFSLVHPRQTPITFRAESQTIADKWFDALSAATNLDCLTLPNGKTEGNQSNNSA